MKYRPEIDGLRAIAVLPVILFHAGIVGFSGGFVGVDIFFVISGYLITTILIDDFDKRRFSLITFYERRARRILPALFFVMIVCIPFAWYFMLPKQFEDFAQSIVAVVFFSSNMLFWQETGYFAASAELKPLLHTWSLAVEEQFYLVFPILLLALWRFGSKVTLIVIVIIAIFSLALSEWGWRNAPGANFYFAFSRAWELLAGSIAAFIVSKHGVQKNSLISLAGLISILASITLYAEHTPFPSVYSLVPVMGVFLVIVFGGSGTLTARVLSLPIFVGIGLISYSAYLWHQPIFAFARLSQPEPPSIGIMLLLSAFAIALAIPTQRYIEAPFRKRSGFGSLSRFTIFSSALAASVAFAAFGVLGHIKQGFPDRFATPELVASGQFELASLEDGFCFVDFDNGPHTTAGDFGTECLIGTASQKAINSALLFGDSFAGQWDPFWHEVGLSHDIAIRSVTTNWCFPALTNAFTGILGHIASDQCQINRKFLKTQAAKYDTIILGGSWADIEKSGYGPDVMDTMRFLLSIFEGHIVVMPSPVAVHRTGVERVIYTGRGSLSLNSERESLINAFNDQVPQALRANARITWLGRDQIFANKTLTPEGLPYSLDGSHISIYGAREAVKSFRSSHEYKALISKMFSIVVD